MGALQAANGSTIHTYGTKRLHLTLSFRRDFHWDFVIADVTLPILGADFLSHFNLLVDMHHNRLIDYETQFSSQCIRATSSISGIRLPSGSTPYESLLHSDFAELITPTASFPEVKHNVVHRIETAGIPPYARARRLAPDKLQAAKLEFDSLLQQGIIRPSKSEYASPLHLVLKPNGDYRPTGDYRSLNAITRPDRYPVPHLQDFTANLEGCKIFSKLDLVKAFYHIPVHPDDVHKTAIITPFGLFEYLRTPFGLRNAAQSFQRFIDNILRGLPFVFAYIDDLLIASASPEEHLSHLRLVFQRLMEYGIRINFLKCVFGVSSLTFLGHSISADGLQPLHDRVSAIRSFPIPQTQRQLRKFLGMVNFYHRFIPAAADILRPLNSLLKPSRKGSSTSTKVDWTDAARDAFDSIKERLASSVLLVFPSTSAPTRIHTDASDFAVGAVLQQFSENEWRPLAFFSKKLQPAELKYSAFGRELLAIYLAIKHFRYFTEGREFHILTDHKPLTYAITAPTTKQSPREARHLEFIAQFTSDIRFVKGAENIPADTLSRVSINSISALPSIDYEEMSRLQQQEQFTFPANSSYDICSVEMFGFPFPLLCDMSSRLPRPVVPTPMRRHVFNTLHNVSHPGVKGSQVQIGKHFVWPTLLQDVKQWAKNCMNCQRSKIHRHTHTPVEQFLPPGQRFDNVHIDLVGPLPPSQGHTHILTCIDRYTRWVEAIPLQDTSSETIAKAFLFHWISRFGTPSTVTTDQGRQFESYLWKDLMVLLGSHRIRTCSYHPVSNGMIERFHRQLKSSLMAHGHPDNWSETLPLVLLGIRTAFKEDLKCSAAELVYGSSIRIPGEFIHPSPSTSNPHSFLARLRQCTDSWKPSLPRQPQRTTYIPSDLDTCTHVLVRHDSHRSPLQARYDGPFQVLKRYRKFFTLQRGTKEENVSLDRIKPAFLDSDPETAMDFSSLSTPVLLPRTAPTDPVPAQPVASHSPFAQLAPTPPVLTQPTSAHPTLAQPALSPPPSLTSSASTAVPLPYRTSRAGRPLRPVIRFSP